MANTTSDSILGVIWKKSWILDHFEIFVNIALNGIGETAAKPNMVPSHGVGGGLRSLTAFFS